MDSHAVLAKLTLRRAVICLVLLLTALGMAVFVPSRVNVQPASGPVSSSENGFDWAAEFLSVNEADIEASKIAVVTGRLWEWTGVRFELVFIRDGVVQEGNCRASVGTNSGRLDHPFFMYRMRATVVIARARTPTGTFAFLEALGMPGGGRGPTCAPAATPTVRKSYDRNVSWRKKEIVYVEGCEEPVVHAGMTLDEFCSINDKGEYLVVIASLLSR